MSDQLQKQLQVSADEEERELKGAERAAVLLLALGESHGAPIWAKLDEIEVGGVKLGFWFAQQGSIYVFVLLIFAYVLIMNRLDRRHGVEED